jgi:predicted dehydrogenase
MVTASFAMLGGIRDQLEVYTTNSVFRANLTGNSTLLAFSPDERAFSGAVLHEKAETGLGWQTVEVDRDWSRGYPQEMADFVGSIAGGSPPMSDLALASDVVEVVYAAYLSAAEGRRVVLDGRPIGTPSIG